MLTGYNTDIKHEGVVYHVQTEDGGTENPVLVSLVYQGGRILVSKKTSYAQLLGTVDFLPKLRDLLERQHRTMIKAILTGTLSTDGVKHHPVEPTPSPRAAQPVTEARPAAAPANPEPAAPAKPPLEIPSKPANQAVPDSSAEKNLDQVILEYLASEIDND
ncbi:MAG: hypothetical protein RRA32_10370 [bacterium]|nr:hypothetical protein [bacterium]